MTRITVILLEVLVPLLLALPAPAQSGKTSIPSPRDIIGFDPGTSGRLADYEAISDYMRALAAASPRVLFRTIGRTTRGLPFNLVIISSPENLERLEELRRRNGVLADPRGKDEPTIQEAVERGKAFVLINESIHSSEVGPAQAGMVTAHFLATTEDPAWLRVLDEVVTLLVPCHNPDGYQVVTEWWRATKDDPKTRGAPLPVLYHEYVGHDNNRDWFMLTQVESRVTVRELHLHWKPQVVVDQHQMGSHGARMFVPPYVDPYEPNIHPNVRRRLEELGPAVARALIASGRRGVWWGESFDAWTPARAYMHYHGAVRFLTEVASALGPDPLVIKRPLRHRCVKATPNNPAPWTMGTWTLADIVDYTSRGALEVLREVASKRKSWLESFLQIHRDTIANAEGPAAFFIPDQGRITSVAKLLDIMLLGGLEVERIETRRPRGLGKGYLIREGQPCFSFARALLENTPYPRIRSEATGGIRRPYDVTSHCLPLLMNLRVKRLPKGTPLPPADESRFLEPSQEQIPPLVKSGPLLLVADDAGGITDVLRVLAGGGTATWNGRSGGQDVFRLDPIRGKVLHRARRTFPSGHASRLISHRGPLRIGLYNSWLASMDEGWTRFLFDLFEVPFTRLFNEDMRAGGLRKRVDVIVLADYPAARAARLILEGRSDPRLPERYRGGIGRAGAEALRTFVQEGGTLVALNGSSRFVVDLLHIPVGEVKTGGRREGRRVFNIPGAMLYTEVDADSPLAAGCTRIMPVFFRRGRAFEATEGAGGIPVAFPVRYVRKGIVAGGHAEGAELLAGHGAVAVCRVGRGRVVLFGFPPQFRCQTWGTFPLFLNALMLAAETPR